MTTALPISLVTAGAAALINFWLVMRVGAIRRQEKVFVGDGGSEALIRRMRAQANFVEQAPFVLILLALIELAHGPSLILWIVASAFLVGRLLHAFGMDGWMPGRTIGTMVSLVVMVGLGITAIVMVARGAGAPVPARPRADSVVQQG